MAGSHAGKLYLVGYGVLGDSKGCTGEALAILRKADELIFRWDRDPIYREIAEQRQTVSSVHDLYRTLGATSDAYRAMADHVTQRISDGRSVAFVTPGHPLICEAASQILLAHCQSHGIPVEVIVGVSFLDLVAAALGRDLTEGAQVIAGSDLYDGLSKALSTQLPLVVCSVNPEPAPGEADSELEMFIAYLSQRYEPDRPVAAVSAFRSKSNGLKVEVHRSTAGTLADLGKVLRRCRLCFWVNGRGYPPPEERATAEPAASHSRPDRL